MMWEFKFYSRGGQGAVTAAKILVNAAILEGKFAQAIPSYGQERKGAPCSLTHVSPTHPLM